MRAPPAGSETDERFATIVLGREWPGMNELVWVRNGPDLTLDSLRFLLSDLQSDGIGKLIPRLPPPK
jgi:hypothetical protein